MYKDKERTCTAIVLLIKPFVWFRSRRRRRRGLLKLPIENIRPPSSPRSDHLQQLMCSWHLVVNSSLLDVM